MAVTEIVTLQLSATLPQSTLTDALNKASATLLAQPGCLSFHGLYALENETDASGAPASKKYQMYIGWTTLEQHMVWTRDPGYGPFLQGLGAIMAPGKPPVVFHTEFIPVAGKDVLADATGAEAGGLVIEVAQLYLSPASLATPSYKADLTEKLSTFFSALHQAFPAELTGNSAFGFSVEEDPIEHVVAGETKKSAVVIALIGWKSKADHLRVSASAETKKLWAPVQATEGIVGGAMWHVVQNPEQK